MLAKKSLFQLNHAVDTEMQSPRIMMGTSDAVTLMMTHLVTLTKALYACDLQFPNDLIRYSQACMRCMDISYIHTYIHIHTYVYTHNKTI